jgi:hypothetical protein
MKKLLLLLLMTPFFLNAQDQAPDPELFIVVDIDVKDGMEDAFEAAVKSHNEKFHAADGLYRARLFYNINGPTGGLYTWVMGPTTYTAMDDRPKGDDHDDDWDKVMEMGEIVGSPGYWDFSSSLSHTVEGNSYSKRLIWMYDIKRGQWKRWSELVGKIKEVYEAKRPNEDFWVVWNDFADTRAGKDAVIIFPFDSWSWMDQKNDFPKLYEEVHGQGSWRHFMNEFSETINGRVDWLRKLVD